MGDAIGTGVTEDAVEGGYEEATKARLQSELRHRGLSDAGDTDDLIARLREDDEEQTDDTAQDDDARDEEASSTEAEEDVEETAATDEEPSDEPAGARERSSSKARSSEGKRSSSKERKQEPRGSSSSRPRLVHDPPLRRAAQLVSRSTGLKVDTVSRAVHEDDAWYVQIELVEVPHVPPSRDIMGSYVVVIGDDGVVRAVERMRQYRRQA